MLAHYTRGPIGINDLRMLRCFMSMPAPIAYCVDMTETIVAFAEPLLLAIPPTSAEQLKLLFGRVIEIWNMWVASSPPWNDSRAIDELADAFENGEVNSAEQHIHKMLAERWLMLFKGDERLVINSSVTVEDGAPVFRCEGSGATPELLEIFKGTPN